MAAASLLDMKPPTPAVTSKRRWQGVIFVVVLHVLGVYALASGLAQSTVELLKGPLTANVVEEVVDEDKPPPPPPPDFKPPPPVVAPPEVTIDLTQAAPAQSTISTTTKPPPPVESTPPRPGRGNVVTEADYPPISRRLNEEGTVQLKLTINAEGRAENVTVNKSSGFPRLDEQAVMIVTNRWRWTPATSEGKPIAVERLMNVKFQLR